jgi:6-phosphogluconolactonase/glucosamine-6-phosphate isomerase/deaminase
MLQFIKAADTTAARDALSKRLIKELSEKKRVLWIISGGSNIPIEVAIMESIPEELQPYLAIMYDERFGPYNHKDSNYLQLVEAGFNPGKSTLLQAITPDTFSLSAATKRYEAAADEAFAHADVIIAQLGLGIDGHISGILPGSPASTAKKLVSGYKSDQYDRITFTFPALKKCNAVYLFAFGESKRVQLETLRDYNLQPKIQPSQILKKIPEAYVYNDQIGDKND